MFRGAYGHFWVNQGGEAGAGKKERGAEKMSGE